MEIPLRCPRCRSQEVVEIIYGLPTEELFREIEEKGNHWIGGCCIDSHSPDLHCKNCGYEGTISEFLGPDNEDEV